MISILMTTYNGEEYVSAQIESLLMQNQSQFRLYIQDDCSTDNTWSILQEFQSQSPNQIFLSRRFENSGNPKFNFYELMSRIADDYVMLCDQDDVWLPDKIEKTLSKMKKMEHLYLKDMPLLVHTDLCVVDKKLNVISPSFKRAMNANYNHIQLKDQIIQNTLTGCTVMYNRALANLLWKVPPKYMIMHDWWLMLVASAFGHIGHIEDQTVLYRQHEANKIGAKDVRTLWYKINKLILYKEIKRAVQDTYTQAESFLSYYKKLLTDGQTILLETYCQIPKMKKWDRWWTIYRLGVFKNGIARKIAHFIFI